jgi:tripartite-type tricarboxylate transporter receptor subunit TctC
VIFFRGLCVLIFLTVTAGPVYCATAAVTEFPTRPLRIIVPLSAGAADTLSRTIGQKLNDAWGQPVIVENRPGAGTTLGSAMVAHATADGYTLLMATFSHAVNATFYKRLPYDTLKSFAAVTLVASAPNVLEVHPSVPARTTAELIALAKAQPGKLNFASAGNGSSSHLAGELFKLMSGIDIVHVPYKGSAPAMADLLGGHVQMTLDPLPSSIGNIRAGKLRALAVTTANRAPLLKDVPTLSESGLPGYDMNGWSGLLVPAGTPKNITSRLHSEIVKVLNMPDVKSRFSGMGFETVGNSPSEFQAFIRREVEKWGKIVKSLNISAD